MCIKYVYVLNYSQCPCQKIVWSSRNDIRANSVVKGIVEVT